MKHIRKHHLHLRLMSTLLAVAAVLPQTAAAYDFVVDGLCYNYNSDSTSVRVTYMSNTSWISGDIIIPDAVTYNGTTYSVTSIGNCAFQDCSGLTSVSIPNSVTSIGSSAFQDCSGLTSVNIGNSVTSIGSSAFWGCNGLTSVTIPNSVTSIGGSAFWGCSGLPSVTIGNSVTEIGNDTFNGCSGLTSVTIGNSVTSIGGSAFSDCSGLTSIDIPNSVTSIGSNAFSGCSGLNSVTIGNSVTSIDDYAFNGCSGLNSVTWNAKSCEDFTLSYNPFAWARASIKNFIFGNEVQHIPAYLCYGMSNLTSIDIPNSVTTIGNGVFSSCSGLASVTIPNSVTSIGNDAFNGCSGLNSLVIGNSVTTIGNNAFSGCSGLTSVTIPNSVTSIDRGAFSGCSGLTSVIIPNSVTSIGEWAFDRCSGLTSVTIPGSVTSIGNYAFYNCDHLYAIESLILNPSDVTVGNTLFSSLDVHLIDKVLLVPSGTRPLYLNADIWNKFSVIHEPEGENEIKFVDPNAFRLCVKKWDADQNGNLSYDEAAAVTNFYGFTDHPEIVSFNELQYFTSLTSIDYKAFSGCTELASLSIPNTVEYVGQDAFLNTSWYDNQPDGLVYVAKAAYQYKGTMPANTGIVLREGTHSITYNCFNNCSGLTSITIPSSMVDIRNAFLNCNGIKQLTWNAKNCGSMGNMPKENIESINIGNAVEVLPNDFVRNSKIASVTIPSSVKIIGSGAFSGCLGLTSTTIPNSVTEIGYDAFNGCSGLTSVTIGNSVTTIGSSAFSGCSGLTTVTIPNNITTIGGSAFSGCDGIKQLTWNAKHCNSTGGMPTGNIETVTIGSLVETLPTNFVQNSKITAVSIPNSVTSIGSSAFSNCSGLTSITIPNAVTFIGSSAFENCSGLTSITIPNAVTYIGYYAFEGCSSIKQLTWNAKNCSSMGHMPKNNIETVAIGNQVVSLPNEFVRNSRITSVTIPNSVTAIGKQAFSDCSGLSEINIPNSVRHIGNRAFYSCIGFTSVTIPAGTDTIADYAFGNCSALADVTFQGTPKNISSTAFYGTPWEQNLGEGLIYIGTLAYHFNWSRPENITVTIRPGTTAIADRCFSNCSKLIAVTIPNSVSSIGDDAFVSCSGLTSVTIPNSVISIGNYAFYNCSGLTSVTIGNSVTTIGKQAFYNCSGLTSVTIPNSVTSIGSSAFLGCSGLDTLVVESGNTVYDSRDNCNALIETASNILIVGCKNSTIPNSVTSIGNYAFYNCSGLTSVTLGNSVTYIGSYAFQNCSGLTSVTIPNSVTTIGNNAFSGCSGLTTVFCLGDLSNQAISPGNSSHGTNVERIAYVPVYLIETYKASNSWSAFTIKPLQQESLYGIVITHTRGDADVDFVVPIGLFNQQSVTSVSFDMHLPDGLSMLTDENGQPRVTLDEVRRSRSHGLMVTPLGNNSYRIKTSSTSNASLKGSLGYLFYASLRLDRYHGSGNEHIVLDNVTATPTGGTALQLDTVKLQLALDYIIGDVDADVVVDVADYVTTNAHIMQRPTICFYADAADCDNNTVIDAADLVAITRYALGRDSKNYRQLPSHDRVRHEASLQCDVSTMAMAHGETRELVMNITSDVDLAAMQLDIELPDGLHLTAFRLGECAKALCVDTATLDNGEVRLLASAFSRDSVPAGQLPLYLTLTATDNWQGGELSLHNAIVVGNDLSRIELDDLTLAVTATTSVGGIKPDQTTCLKVVGNKVVTDTPTDGTMRIISVNGQVRSVFVKAGHNEHILYNRGVVIIELNGTTLKTILP